MSNSNNILLLVKKHHEQLVAKYTSRINQLEAEKNDVNNKLALLTTENETLRKEFDSTINLLTKYFDSLDVNTAVVSSAVVKPTVVSPAIVSPTIVKPFVVSPAIVNPTVVSPTIETTKTVQFNIDQHDPKPLFSPPYKYLPRRHKSFTQAKRVPLVKRLQQYKPSNYQDSSDTDEDPKIMPSPESVPAESTPISVLKKILTDDFSAPKNNKDAPYSFNNMKPYIFTLDKNNKK
jgi:hypothetical protein